MLCRIDRGKVRFWSRNGKDWTEKFLNVIEAVKSLPVKSAILDGEIVVVDAQGHSSFQKLQRSMGKSVTAGFVFEVFDLIYLDGFSLVKTPLRQRKLLLKDLCKTNGSRGAVRYSEHLEGNGDAFFKHACEYGIEGIVSKLADSPYESTRDRNWLKVKCNKQQKFVDCRLHALFEKPTRIRLAGSRCLREEQTGLRRTGGDRIYIHTTK